MQNFIKSTLMYSGGPIIGRILTLFLLPFMTQHLTPADYGVIAILTLIPLLLTSILSLGFQTSLGKIYAQAEQPPGKQAVISTAFLALLINNACWLALALFFRQTISLLLFGTDSYSGLVIYALVSAAVTAVRFPFEYYLRAMELSRSVFLLNLLEIALTVATLCLFVIHWHGGAQGYMQAVCLAQALNLLTVCLLLANKLPFVIQKQPLIELISLGIPCIYGYVGYCILQNASRYILELLSSEAEVGLYFLGSNMGRVIELPLWGFMSAWVPFFHQKMAAAPREATPLFSKMMSYYLLGMGFCCAAIFCFARPIVHWLVSPIFHEIWKVAGLSAVAQALWGSYAISYPAIIYFKKTTLQAALELGAGAICIVANLLLIPLMGIGGAAIGTLLAFISLNLLSVKVNQAYCYTPYEHRRIAKLVAALSGCALLSFMPIQDLTAYCSLMCLTLVTFGLFCWGAILNADERIRCKSASKMWMGAQV